MMIMYRGSIKGKISNMDKDLAFMTEIGNENLATFVDVLIEKGGITETLSVSDEYKAYGKDYSCYWDRIELEFREFGSNTFTNIFGEPDEYKEILRLVLKKFGIKYKKIDSVEDLEGKLLEKLITDIWEELEPQERVELLKGLDEFSVTSFDRMMELFKGSGAVTYSLSALVANSITTNFINRGILLTGVSIGGLRAISNLSTPVGNIMISEISFFDIAGPAYRVIVPCTILIAAFRKMHNNNEL